MQERCESCGLNVFTEQKLGPCKICAKETCVKCSKVCDRCLQGFCSEHVKTYEIWRQGTLYLHKLCENCKEVWKGK